MGLVLDRCHPQCQLVLGSPAVATDHQGQPGSWVMSGKFELGFRDWSLGAEGKEWLLPKGPRQNTCGGDGVQRHLATAGMAAHCWET